MPNVVNILPILTVNFIGTLGYSIVMPFLIYLVVSFGGNAVIYGVLGATYSAFQLIGAPLLGKYSDIYGRKPILLLSQIGTLLAWVLFLIALLIPNLHLLEIESSMMSSKLWAAEAWSTNSSSWNAYLVDISTEENRKLNFGKMAASSNLGFIIGPVLAGVLGATALGAIAPTLAALLISFAAVVIIVKLLPDHSPTKLTQSPCRLERCRRTLGKEIKDCYEQKPNQAQLKVILRIPNIMLMFVLYFLIFLAFNIFYTAFPIHAAEGLQWPIAQLGIYFSLLSLMMILVQGPIMSLIAEKVTEEPLVILGSIGMFGSFMLLQSHELWSIYLAAVLFAIGNGIMWPSFLSILGRFGSEQEQGYIQGLASSAGSFASIIGLVVGGVLYISIGTTTFMIGAVIFVAVFILSFYLRSNEQQMVS